MALRTKIYHFMVKKSRMTPKIQDGGRIVCVSSDQKVRYYPKEFPYKIWCLLPVCN